jgi:hypothetical protein
MSRISKFIRVYSKEFGFWTTLKIRLSWYFHTKLVKALSLFNEKSNQQKNSFRESWLATGVLVEDDLKTLKKCVSHSPNILVTQNDYHENYCFNPKTYKVESRLKNEGYIFFDLKESMPQIKKVTSNLGPIIKNCLGHPFRIANIRCWELLANAGAFGSNTWHGDGFPYQVFKLLVYLSAPEPERGTTKVKLASGEIFQAEGPPGTWLLFDSTKLTHSGVPPLLDSRTIMEFTIIPSFKENIHPVFAGQNATYPFYPWNVCN